MSSPSQLNAGLTKKIQQRLKDLGYYQGSIDGSVGPMSRAAVRQWASDTLAKSLVLAPLDPRSFDHIYGRNGKNPLHSKLQPLASLDIQLLRTLGLDARIISGYRTYAEQDALYFSGRGVTKARGGYSNHNFALAYDIGIFVDEDLIPDVNTGDDKYLEESGLYLLAGEVCEVIGLKWGGRWTSIVDTPHREYPHGVTTAILRSRVAAKRDVVTGEPL